MPFVPPRPLKVKVGFSLWSIVGGALMVAVGFGAGVGYLMWQWHEAQDLLATQERWERAVPTEAEVGGEVQSRMFIFDDYNLEITYLNPKGDTLAADYSFSTLMGGPDIDSEVAVRFDADKPELPVVSWAVESWGARWRAIVFMVGAGLLIAFSFIFLGWAALRKWRAVSLAGASSVEVHCPVLESKVQKANGQSTLEILYEVPSDMQVPLGARGKKLKAVFRLPQRRPLFADAEGSMVVVLVSQVHAKVPVAMTSDLHPYTLDPAQQELLKRSLARPL